MRASSGSSTQPPSPGRVEAAHDQVEALERGLFVGEVAASSGRRSIRQVDHGQKLDADRVARVLLALVACGCSPSVCNPGPARDVPCSTARSEARRMHAARVRPARIPLVFQPRIVAAGRKP